ncbi:hypothetical protein FHX11_000844 [Rhizobium sp. BK602]|nr:hypothetical protein [Rhizobium sp. BK602]
MTGSEDHHIRQATIGKLIRKAEKGRRNAHFLNPPSGHTKVR